MSTAANTSTETHEIEKGIFLTIKAMNQQTADGDPVTVHIFTVSLSYLLELSQSIDHHMSFHIPI